MVPDPFDVNVFDASFWSAAGANGHYITDYDSIGNTYTAPAPAIEYMLNRDDNDLAWTGNPFVQTCAAWTRELAGTKSVPAVTSRVYNYYVDVSATPIESSISYDCEYDPCLNFDALTNSLLLETPL